MEVGILEHMYSLFQAILPTLRLIIERMCSQRTTAPKRAGVSRDEIVESALAVAREKGLAALTGRLAAERAGISPSAINYQFGGFDGLVRAVHERLEREGRAWRRRCLETLRTVPREIFSPGGIVAGIIAELAAREDRRALLVQQFRELVGVAEIDLAGGPEREWSAGESFWRELLTRWPEQAEAAEAWMMFATGALTLAFMDAEPAVRFAWVSDAAQRFADRLTTPRQLRLRSVAPAAPAAGPPVSEEPDWPEGKRRIVEAALRLIGEHGVGHVTHRRVAEAAGLSLASTTYFFRTKNDLIVEAFATLYRRTMTRSILDSSVSTALGADVLFTDAGAIRWEVGALQALYLAATHDASLKAFAAGLRDVRGRGSLRWLQARGLVEVDRLDGLVWSLVVGGMFQRTILLARRRRRAFLQDLAERLFQRLFC